MTTFAILYNRQDLTAIAAEATNPGLTGGERNEINRYWNAGLRDWASAPIAPIEYRCVNTPQGTVCDDDMRVVVISSTQVSKAGLIAWLRAIGAKYAGALYMLAIADDLTTTAVEPWPPA